MPIKLTISLTPWVTTLLNLRFSAGVQDPGALRALQGRALAAPQSPSSSHHLPNPLDNHPAKPFHLLTGVQDPGAPGALQGAAEAAPDAHCALWGLERLQKGPGVQVHALAGLHLLV